MLVMPDDIGAPGYIGPVHIYDRYMSGEVVTRTDALTDQSKFVARPMSAHDRKRLRWMLDNLELVDGKPERTTRS
ncbi:hypothetical protein NIIDNTM18_41990 [Mycolicibacterium litorale]|uniref:Uncharacterized protein n=1 Tax=Mycolicibacterium litorale TaxID=758802 RepID=A0A6S6PB19_9MYCO|nr:hypothetical protein [Mycolicibacterium litorale]BCI54921.1 hypothetical protein NIIDNTM18_41990 [Mycolicibacterium litorale]